jgi:hypothetical protein
MYSFAIAVPHIVIDLKKEDVLLGRGKRVQTWLGNVLFRRLCEGSAAMYAAADRHAKDSIVRNIITRVHGSGGRFLAELEISDQDDGGQLVNLDHRRTRTTVWQTVSSSVIRTKVKQACRDNIRIRQRGSSENNKHCEIAPSSNLCKRRWDGGVTGRTRTDPSTAAVLPPQKRASSTSSVPTNPRSPTSSAAASDGGAMMMIPEPEQLYQPSDRELQQALLSWCAAQEEARTTSAAPQRHPLETVVGSEPTSGTTTTKSHDGRQQQQRLDSMSNVMTLSSSLADEDHLDLLAFRDAWSSSSPLNADTWWIGNLAMPPPNLLSLPHGVRIHDSPLIIDHTIGSVPASGDLYPDHGIG